MLNPSKPYYQTAKFLKENSVSKKTLINEGDKVWKLITSYISEDHIFYHDWTSFSNIHSEPTTIRLRDDKLLTNAKEKKLTDTFAIVSCIKIDGKKLYFVITSNYFTHYSFKTTSSNSFICWDLSDLKNWIQHPNKVISSYRRVKHKGNVPTYSFWVGDGADLESLKSYITILAQVESANFAAVTNNKKAPADEAIPKKISDEIKYRYDNICGLLKNKSCVYYGESESVHHKLTNHEHHIVPREWFRIQSSKKSIHLNNKYNLILLCDRCHKNAHCKNPMIRKHTLDSIVEVIKQVDVYDEFIEYLHNDLNITLPILYRIYGVDYD